MRVALVTNFCPFYRVKLFAILAARLGVRFLFFSDATEKNWESLNPRGGGRLPVVNLHQPPAGRMRVMCRLARALWHGGYDVVVQGLSGRWAVLVTWLVTRVRRTPLVIWTGIWHHPRSLAHQLTFPFVRMICRRADALVAYGTHVRDYLVSIGVAPEKIFMGWNTADNALYSKPVSADEAAALRAGLGLGMSRVVLFVGRLDEEKGVEYLLAALERMKKRNNRLDVRALIAGHGPKEKELKAFCADQGLGNVLFLDYVANDQIYKYYHLADIVVVPSVTTRVFKEPWGLIVNEAMNQGCVVVASDAVGAARGGLIENGKNGLVVPERNADALADALAAVLENDALCASLSAAARDTIAHWTYERMAQGFIDAVMFAAQKCR